MKYTYFSKEAEDFFEEEGEGAWIGERISSKVLQEKLASVKPYPFMEYVKRHIYQKSRWIDREYSKIENKDFYIKALEYFAENEMQDESEFVRKQFGKKGMSVYMPNKETVMKWVFGLNMELVEAEAFIRKSCRSRAFHFRNIYEVCCYYALNNKYGYQKVKELLSQYIQRYCNDEELDIEVDEKVRETAYFKDLFREVHSDDEFWRDIEILVAELQKKNVDVRSYKDIKGIIAQRTDSITVRKKFEELVNKLKEDVLAQMCEVYDSDKILAKEEEAGNTEEAEKKEKSMRKNKGRETMPDSSLITYLETESTDIDNYWLDNVILNWGEWFRKLRVNIDHNTLANIKNGSKPITRENILTFAFLIYDAGEVSKGDWDEDDYGYTDEENVLIDFTGYVNNILVACEMQELYLANPYDMFIAICVLSEDPLETLRTTMNRVNTEKRRKNV